MGWDYVDYGDRHVQLHDMQLWALRHFLADAARSLAAEDSDPDLFEQAQAFFAAWGWPGPGVVTGTTLDDFVQGSPARERALVRICDRAAGRLRAFGELVPLAYLETFVNADSPGGVYTGPQPSTGFIQGLERIRSLLIPDSESSAEATCGHV